MNQENCILYLSRALEDSGFWKLSKSDRRQLINDFTPVKLDQYYENTAFLHFLLFLYNQIQKKGSAISFYFYKHKEFIYYQPYQIVIDDYEYPINWKKAIANNQLCQRCWLGGLTLGLIVSFTVAACLIYPLF